MYFSVGNKARAAAGGGGGRMASRKLGTTVILLVLIFVAAMPAAAQSFRVQCPTSTITHPNAANNNTEPAYVGPTYTGTAGYPAAPGHVNGAIKCQQISGGDGYATMGDGTQTYLFSFGPLSGITDIALGKPGTEIPNVFNTPYAGTGATTANYLVPGDPATTVAASTVPLTSAQLSKLASINYNGAVDIDYDVANTVSIYDISESGTTVTVIGNAPLDLNLQKNAQILIAGGTDVPNGYKGTWTVTAVNVPNAFFPANFAFQYTAN